MKRILFFLSLLFTLGASAQTYNPVNGTLSNKPYAPAQAVPTDMRSYYYDSSIFTFRAYQDTIEVLSYLNLAKWRGGNYLIYVNEDGVLNPDGTFTGGTVEAWWFKDGVADVNLVPFAGSGGSGSTETWEDVLNNQGALPFGFVHNTDLGSNNFTLSNSNIFTINTNTGNSPYSSFQIAPTYHNLITIGDSTESSILVQNSNTPSTTTARLQAQNASSSRVHVVQVNPDSILINGGLSGADQTDLRIRGLPYGNDTSIVKPVVVGANGKIYTSSWYGSGAGAGGIRDTAYLVQGPGIYINNFDSTYKPNGFDVQIAADTAYLRNYFNQFYNTYQIDTSQVDFIVYEIDATPNYSLPNGTKVLVANSGTTGAFVSHENEIATLAGGVYTYQVANGGSQLLVSTTQAAYQFNSIIWSQISYAWLGGGNLLGIPLSGGTIDAQLVILKTKDIAAITIDTLQNVAVNKFIDTRPGNYLRIDSTTGNIDTGFFKPLGEGTNITFTYSGDSLYINSTGGGSGGTLQDAYDNSITATDNPLIDANGGVFNIDDANNILLYSTPHPPTSNLSVHDFATRDAGGQRYSGISSIYGVSGGDTSITASVYASNTLTQIGHILNVSDTSTELQQFWGTGTSSDNTIQKFAHPPPIAGQIYYIPVSVNGEVADAAGNITVSSGGSGAGNNLYNTDSLLASNRTVGLNGNTLEFSGAATLLLNPVSGSESVLASTTDGTGNSNLYIRSNTDDGNGFGVEASDGTDAISIIGDAAANSITHTSALHTFNGTVSIPNVTSANGITLTAGTNSGYIQAVEIDNALGLRMKYGNTDIGGGMRRNIGNNTGELRIYSDSTINNAYMTFYTKGSRAMLIDSNRNVLVDNKIGIRTTSPSDILQVGSGTGASVLSNPLYEGIAVKSSTDRWKFTGIGANGNEGVMFSDGARIYYGTMTNNQVFFLSNNVPQAAVGTTGVVFQRNEYSPTFPASSIATFTSTTQGILPPRMTQAQRDAISSPATALTLFCTDCTATDASTGVTQTWNGAAWKNYW